MNCNETDITDLGHGVFQIDTKMAGYQGITAGYLIRGSRPCLVETGTAPSAPIVAQALESLGVGVQDLASVVVTHIHLDHAGGAGDIAAMYPKAEIVVHQRGARHLTDPSRLMASAKLRANRDRRRTLIRFAFRSRSFRRRLAKRQLLTPNLLKNLGRRQNCCPVVAPASSRSSGRLDRCAARVARLIAELLLDPDELVVFRQPVGAGERPSLDLPAVGGDREIGDRRILGLP